MVVRVFIFPSSYSSGYSLASRYNSMSIAASAPTALHGRRIVHKTVVRRHIGACGWRRCYWKVVRCTSSLGATEKVDQGMRMLIGP